MALGGALTLAGRRSVRERSRVILPAGLGKAA